MPEHVDPYRIYLDHSKPQSLETALTDFYINQHEAQDVAEELEYLFKPFRTKPMAGRRHFAPSSAWRDELTMLSPEEAAPMPQRFVVRVHLFEDSCGQAGRYLGFVSLRPPNAKFHRPTQRKTKKRFRRFHYVIDAELGAPAYMQRPRYHVLTTTASSGRLGVLPFKSAVYSTPSGRDKGAACTHLAVSQALHLIMGRFGCRPISQEEFRWHLWRHTKRSFGASGLSIGNVSEEGANPWDALTVIRESCNGGGFQRSVVPRANADGTLSETERELVMRHLTDCLACGLPVIAIVRAGHLLTDETQNSLPANDKTARLDIPHAVLILGMHLLHSNEEVQHGPDTVASLREDHAELPGRLIIHDTLHRGPFFEWMMSDFIEAALEAYKDPRHRGVHLLTVGPKEMRLGNHRARFATEGALDGLLINMPGSASEEPPLEFADLKSLHTYVVNTRVPFEHCEKATQWRSVCRLLSPGEIVQRYRDRSNLKLWHGDFNLLPGSFSWVVEVRHPLARANATLPRATTPEDQPPALVYVWDVTQEPKRDDAHQTSQGITPAMILLYNPNSAS